MIFWMRRRPRSRGELRGKLEPAMGLGALAVVVMAFLAVGREGLETALLFFAAAQGPPPRRPVIGFVGGLATAVVLGWLIYQGAVRINLATFFPWTGVLLIFVAAGILSYGVHDLQEAGILPGPEHLAFDVSGQPTRPLVRHAAAGHLQLLAAPTVLEAVAWVGYAVPS